MPDEPYEDPIVLWDEDGPVTDSQLREIVEAVQAEMAEHPPFDPRMLPPYWKNETSGILQPAITAFIERGVYGSKTPAPTPEQMGLIKQYLALYINAPCWQEGVQGQLAALRQSVNGINDLASCDRWLDEAMKWGFDPL
jgi:hypothetical protein